jgi:hypothetical protein
VALTCALASARRLALAVAPTSLEPSLLLDALAGAGAHTWTRLRDGIVARALPWESELFAAFVDPSSAAREASVNEQLLELDWRAQRWSRVPRVCASIATSAGLCCAAVAVLTGPAMTGSDTLASLMGAIDSLALGIAGTCFCVAVHLRARRVLRERLASTDRLIERLRRLASAAEGA